MKLLYVFIVLAFPGYLQAQDWPNLKRYRSENEALEQKPVPKDRVVFMGNSITENWAKFSPRFFEANHFVGRGISAQTSPQMLLRFRADVISLQPQAVVIECGTNDIAGNTGPSTLAMIEDNIQSMAELAKANKIKVILGSVLPANKFWWAPALQPADSIIALNKWIKAYAESQGYAYVDYYTPLVDENKGLKKEYSEDGVHPNEEGYAVMEKLVIGVIRKWLRSEARTIVDEESGEQIKTKQMKEITAEEQELFDKIDEILWIDWDPIDVKELGHLVKDVNDLRDEYQSYTPGVFNLVVSGADIDAIAENLFDLETTPTSEGNRQRCSSVAAKIVAVREKYEVPSTSLRAGSGQK